ncbi:hypothetical protein BV22DRAFT_1041315 [Leucogyrophana mollusca]|uniref:Uncharacterized protein n=1 Tax=Leucogyrophana mollusca TaxID=85980 RepID=A0ACB8B0B2_9AGAM|nr:hypothetical protein BV22DRAFT_1041315 [Leucogyrophana mollusca]
MNSVERGLCESAELQTPPQAEYITRDPNSSPVLIHSSLRPSAPSVIPPATPGRCDAVVETSSSHYGPIDPEYRIHAVSGEVFMALTEPFLMEGLFNVA